jgi:hypothetical protein
VKVTKISRDEIFAKLETARFIGRLPGLHTRAKPAYDCF